MPRKMSRHQRKAEFVKAAEAMGDSAAYVYECMEDWYDAHPDASFEEIEAELRQRRRGLMGQTLSTLIVGRDTGFEVQPPPCPQCGQPMVFQDYRPWTVKGLEGDSQLERAYYDWCANRAPPVGDRVFPPLDQKLRLRSDHWSPGAARVATRQGLQAQSFDLAAEGFADAVGRSISADSVAAITQGFGELIGAQRAAEAEAANRPAQRGESPDQRRVAEVAAISGQANVSTDGATPHLRSAQV